ncbi:MAG: serine--tRNA ligase [Planctomycetota bacterium]|nr:MAG: serine--tRNA ligase [Planctomycetota bacterium]
MINPKYFRSHFDEVKKNCENRNLRLDLDEIRRLDEKRQKLDLEVQEIQRKRNEIAKAMKGPMEKEKRMALVEEGKALKEEESQKKEELHKVEERFYELFSQIPNLTHPDSPVGKTDDDNREIRRWGKIPSFSFSPRDHVEIGEKRGWLDFEGGAKVAGSKFYYLRQELVLLEFALIRFALDILLEEGFQIYTTPDLARQEIVEGIGFNPRGEESQIYSIAPPHNLCLIGTAEITLGGLFQDTIFEADQLPLLLGGVSHCFRTEAGSHGKVSKGLYRVHQFTKVEMFAYTLPEESEAMHQRFLEIEEKIYQTLEIPYRVVDVCTGELGGPAYRKFDIEAWMPGRGEGGEWGEITSTSNCTDYQARRLKIRFKRDKKSKTELVHMLNGTAIAISRTLIALMENFQQEDYTIKVPKALQKYVGREIL